MLDNPSVKREMNLNIGVTAKNKFGYKVVVNSKTDNTALDNSDPATADKTWLRIDAAGTPGYFTAKP